MAILVMGWVFKFALESVKRDVNKRWDEKDRDDKEYRKEQIEDAIRAQRGQQVMGNALREILRHMITGNHIEDLERVQQDLEVYSAENNEALLKKAAKHNMRIR